MLKIEDLIRNYLMKDVAGNHVLSSRDLLKLMKEILSLVGQDLLLARNKIQMISIYRYIDV